MKIKKDKNEKKPLFLKRLFFSFLLACFIFFVIFSFTSSVDYSMYQRSSNQINEIEQYINELSVFIDNQNCNNFLFDDATKKLKNSVYKIGFLEKEFGKDDLRVLEHKKMHTELQFLHYLLVEELNEKCNTGINVLFFFYENSDEKDIQTSVERMSFIAGYYLDKNEGEVMLYSFDYRLDSEIVSELIEKYNITEVPVLIEGKSGAKIQPSNINELNEFMNNLDD